MERHELIGLFAKVVKSTDRNLLGIEGYIVNESRNMITLATKDSSLKRVSKNSAVFELSVPEKEKIQIAGVEIVGRPENRIKKKR